MANVSYTGLTLTAVRNDYNGVYDFGVEIDGAWIVLAGSPIGTVDAAVQVARDEADRRTLQQATAPDAGRDGQASPADTAVPPPPAV